MRAPDQPQVKHAGQRDVVEVAAPAGDETGVLLALDRGADEHGVRTTRLGGGLRALSEAFPTESAAPAKPVLYPRSPCARPFLLTRCTRPSTVPRRASPFSDRVLRVAPCRLQMLVSALLERGIGVGHQVGAGLAQHHLQIRRLEADVDEAVDD